MPKLSDTLASAITDTFIFDPHEDTVKNIAALNETACLDELVSAASDLLEMVEIYAWMRSNGQAARVRAVLTAIAKAQALP